MSSIIERAAQGERKALVELYKAACSKVYYITYYLLRDQEAAEAACIWSFRTMWHDLGKQGIEDEGSFVDNTVRKAVYYCRKQILHKNPKAYNVPINHNFILTGPFKVSKKSGSEVDVILAMFTPLQRLIFVLHTAAGYTAKDISRTTDINIKTINTAIDAESTNIEKILKAMGKAGSASAAEIIQSFTEKASNIPVPDAVDTSVMEIIDRISAPIEKKARNQKTSKHIATFLIACFLIWAVSNAVEAVTSDEINQKSSTTATETTATTEAVTEDTSVTTETTDAAVE